MIVSPTGKQVNHKFLQLPYTMKELRFYRKVMEIPVYLMWQWNITETPVGLDIQNSLVSNRLKKHFPVYHL